MSVKILGIETSCDETAASVVADGSQVLSNAVFSQIDIHQQFGGVVPEIASRNHVQKLPYIVRQAMDDAGLSFGDLDAVAVTYTPGLIGALIAGVSYAKALSYALRKPLVAVNHIEGHISANFITTPLLTPPFVCLIASGGHTNIANVVDYGQYELLGATRDDAAGEAIDKIARVLGLPYPGGPHLEKLAEQGDPNVYEFPRMLRGQDTLDFSFSGLKTAAINRIHELEQRGEPFERADVAAGFQHCVVSALTEHTFEAVRRTKAKKVALAGGVSANGCLRQAFSDAAAKAGVELFVPDMKYTGDNAAMIASAAYFRFVNGQLAPLTLNARPYEELFG